MAKKFKSFQTRDKPKKRGEKKILITAKLVRDALKGVVEDQDLSRYIL